MKNISIILPVFNSEKTIGTTIESILKQNYEDYQLIIVNDHSEDNTKSICIEYQEKNPDKIIYFDNLENKKGVSSARNLAISQSNSKYIMFIDSDDCYSNNMLLLMNKEIEDNDLTICGFKQIDLKTKSEKNKYLDNTVINSKNEIIKTIELLQRQDLFNQLWNKIFRSEIIKKNNLMFSEDISLGEDYRFILDYTEHVKNIKIINEILYTYYSAETGLALKFHPENLKIKLENILYHKKTYITNNICDKNYINKFYVLTVLSGLASIVDNNNLKDSRKIIREYIEYKKIEEVLNEMYNETDSIKLKCLIKLIQIKNITYRYFLGKSMVVAKKIYRKIK